MSRTAGESAGTSGLRMTIMGKGSYRRSTARARRGYHLRMTRTRIAAAWLTACALAWPFALPIAAQEAKLDALGDPLPAGALARYGTHRLRHEGAVWAVTFVRGGTAIASASADGTVCVWDPADGRKLD